MNYVITTTLPLVLHVRKVMKINPYKNKWFSLTLNELRDNWKSETDLALRKRQRNNYIDILRIDINLLVGMYGIRPIEITETAFCEQLENLQIVARKDLLQSSLYTAVRPLIFSTSISYKRIRAISEERKLGMANITSLWKQLLVPSVEEIKNFACK